MRRCLLLSCTLFLLAATALSQLNRYKTWAETPEAYFMTAAERAEWSHVKNDAEAEAFVARYYARRGIDFMEELSQRIQRADEYLSTGEKKGSETLRGKFFIVFGPPMALERTAMSRRTGQISSMTNAGAPSGTAPAIKTRTVSKAIDTMTWSGERLPTPITEPITVRVETDAEGREKIKGTKQELAKLDLLIEAVARNTIR